jgi:hypothetical protein
MTTIVTERQRVRRWIADTGAPLGSGPIHFHADCISPAEVFVRGLPDRITVKLGLERFDTASVATIFVPCRKCDPCLKRRTNIWTARAIDETRLSSRTWFSTLTLHPSAALEFRARGEQAYIDRGWPVEELRGGVLFKAFAGALGPELQRWLKRVRKNSGASLRYILVCEAHKSGVPHFHALVHETGDGKATKRTMEAAWRIGFSQFRLVDRSEANEARYVCKYLAKSALTRIRASRHYGSISVDHHADLLEQVAAVVAKAGNGPRRRATSRIKHSIF